ncbi:hypothetical protein D5038_16425 [Verminephrobacter aporrectodeae subsp. tuberculatae]|uniref:hypothetical protein n=1 Tax=Verminephrobacter aporrectodeae TaxID=1110389 RepID=UPI0022388C2D|nr:hypothetical protein [Verminephrobacter aporrectodeae]MCW5257895.1 hypothetical protein [Verminephrobacter aporrectodeae subsp. tuberculatae]MCW8207750.1 hypothetical protein [Verminephrobacter aporrectodeae subsp. tuberculatae]
MTQPIVGGLIAAGVLVVAGLVNAASLDTPKFDDNAMEHGDRAAPSQVATATDAARPQRAPPSNGDAAGRVARLQDFAPTAPAAYGAASASSHPAGCAQMNAACQCYTPQARPFPVSGSVCLQIVKQGFSIDQE